MTNKLVQSIKDQIIKNELMKPNDRIIVGLSGGVDSVALLGILNVLKNELCIELYPIYVHHGLRDDADEDVAFCYSLCEKLQLNLEVVYVNVYEHIVKTKETEEEAARNLRYDALRNYLVKVNGSCIAVAHHKDDQAETVLHRFLRGSGTLGLSGMDMKSKDIVRPLLKTSKRDLEEYVKNAKLGHMTDSTNKDDRYTRNRIRMDLIPYLESYNDNLVENLNRLSQLLSDDEQYMSKEAIRIHEIVLRDKNSLDISLLEQYDIAMIRRVIRHNILCINGNLKNIEFNHIQRIVDLMDLQSGKQADITGQLVVKKEYNKLIFTTRQDEQKSDEGFSYTLDTIPIIGYIQEVNIAYTIRKLDESENKELIKYKDSFKISKNIYTKCFDYDKIKANLVLRTRKSGDFIHIHKDSGSKTIKKFFIDEKIPASLRNKIPLLAIGNEILWVVGYRVNPKYQVSVESKDIIEVELLKEDNNGKY